MARSRGANATTAPGACATASAAGAAVAAAFGAVAGAMLTTLGGCGASASSGGDAVARAAERAPMDEAPLGTRQARTPALAALVAADNGLEVRRWAVQDDGQRIAAALRRHGWPLEDDELRTRLERNGFVLTLVPEERLEAFADDIGQPLADVRVWHGQATQWRELLRQPAHHPVAVVVDGRVRVFEGGALCTLARGWTMPMEDGALLQLELVQRFEQPAPGVDLRALLPGAAPAPPDPGETVGGGVIELQLAPGETWVLTCLRPHDSASAEDDAAQTRRERGPLPDDGLFGPSTQLPLTLGELLLSSETPSLRTLLIFLPRLPAPAGSVAPTFEPTEWRSGGPAADGSGREGTQPAQETPGGAPAAAPGTLPSELQYDPELLPDPDFPPAEHSATPSPAGVGG